MIKANVAIQRFVDSLNNGVSQSELEQQIIRIPFKEVKVGDNILYLPDRQLGAGLINLRDGYFEEDNLLRVKPSERYTFAYNIDSRKIELGWVGGTLDFVEFEKDAASAIYRLR